MVQVENQELLIQRLGRWPSFHDAEVVRVRFEREGPDAPYMECSIHVFEATSELDARGYYVLKNHTLVTLRFCQVEVKDFGGWNRQNVLFGLRINQAQRDSAYVENPPIEVELDASYGCGASLTCSAVKVVGAEEFKVG